MKHKGIQNLEELARWFLEWAGKEGYTEEEAVELANLDSIEFLKAVGIWQE